jgi:3-isopropylmalate dehydrogenase
MKKTIAILEGDGIGPEIMKEGIKVLNAVSKKYKHNFELKYAAFGAKAYFDHGHPFPEDTKKICDKADAILKGPIGLALAEMKKIPPEFSPEGAALLPLRARYDTYANFRPVVLPLSFADFSPLKKERLGTGINIMMIRELVGGNYFGKKVEGKDTNMQYSIDEGKYESSQVKRIAKVAFEEARKRKSKLTNVSKPNVMAEGRFWNAIVDEISKNYPDVALEHYIVDNMAFQLMINPSRFNGVVLMENMQGDILTDQAGGILGSLGLMPSACLNPETGRGYYEPAHGSAPDIAGKNIANPYSMIGSVAFMLEKSFGLEKESKLVWDALTQVFAQGFRTGELAGKDTPKEKILSTTQFGDKVVEIINSK